MIKLKKSKIEFKDPNSPMRIEVDPHSRYFRIRKGTKKNYRYINGDEVSRSIPTSESRALTH